MARALSGDYQTAVAATIRKPEAAVSVWHGSPPVELDITSDVTKLSITLTEEHRAGRAVLDIANDSGEYDPIGGGALAGALTENNKVVIQLGYSGILYTAFTGRIAGARMRYQRGTAEGIEVTCLDRGKNFWRQQVTSTLYETEQANDIVIDLFTTYGGMERGDIDLAGLDYEIERVQFIEENLMDAGAMCLEPGAFRLYFDHDGILCSRAVTARQGSSWDYTGGDVVWLRYGWADPTVNKVVVSGRTLDPEESLGIEVRWVQCVNKGMGVGVGKRTSTYWEVDFPGAPYYTENRVDLITNPGGVIKSIGIFQEDRDGVWVIAKHSASSPGDWVIDFDIYGKETTVITPVVSGSAEDAVLIEQYGEVIEDVDNPLIQSNEDAAALAEEMLRIGKWYRYRPAIRVPNNLVHEPGDRITVANPRTGQTHTLYIRTITHKHRRGKEHSTELGCLLVEDS